ncbi:MAG: holo-ACP synthase [Phycisphaerales bacterium]|nr:holo-ACP synthase [Phycisphaerales bacterium]
MNVLAHGVDLVAIARIERIWRDHGEHFLTRIYTPAERDYCLDCKTPAIRLSGRFAAKEAVLKVLGTGWRGGIEWTDIETLPDPLGRPVVKLTGESARIAAERGIADILVSISHAGDYAMASAIGVARS